MTVNECDDPANVECLWFYDQTNTNSQPFHQDCLKLAQL